MATLTFHRAYPEAIPPMAADKSALGTLPLPAFRFCEALRQGSALGWYIFPPSEATLRFDGRSVYVLGEDRLEKLSSVFLGDEFSKHWQSIAPPEFQDEEIPWLSSLSHSGHVQVWSGLFVSTAPDWQLLIMPLANVPQDAARVEYQGLVRTDLFQPAPLFYNFNIVATDRDVHIRADFPLFQVVAIPSEISKMQQSELLDIGAPDAPLFDWDGYGRTSRGEDEDHTIGRYGANIRRVERKPE